MKYPYFNISSRVKFLLRYIISGGIGALIQLSTDVIMVEFFNKNYRYGVVIGFFIALCITFLLQKYWTFREQSRTKIKLQFAYYTAIALLSLAGNLSLTTFFVERMSLHYLFAHIVTIGIVVGGSFLLNNFLTFRQVKDRLL